MGRLKVSLACLVSCFLAAQIAFASQNWENTLVRVTSYVQPTDMEAPWRTQPIREDNHMGIVLDDRHILVSTYAVAYGQSFEYQAIGAAERLPLELAFADYNLNLALLTPIDNARLTGFTAAKLGDQLQLGDEFKVLTARGRQRLIEYTARVREVQIQPALFASYNLPHYAFETQRTEAGWSEPLVHNNQLVGITVSKRSETVFAMPASVIRKFYSDYVSQSYRGSVKLGFSFEPLTSIELRSYAGAEDIKNGVWIERVRHDSPFYGALKSGDVLLQVGDIHLSDQGLFDHPSWGRISFTGALYQYHGGEKLNLKILRQGEQMLISGDLQPYDPLQELIPWDVPREEPYLIFGGLLFQELSQAYLKRWGSNWRTRAPLYLLNLWTHHNHRSFPEQERIIILNRVLADVYNKGYGSLNNMRVTRVNGVDIHSLEDVRRALREKAIVRDNGRYAVFEFSPYQHKVILSYDDIAAAHNRMALNYNLKLDDGFWSEDKTTAATDL